MKLIKPSFEILEQEVGLEGVYKQIEKVGRTCYKSEDRIAEGTAKGFVDRMIKSGHGAMLEHGTVYLYIEFTSPLSDRNFLFYSNIKHKYSSNKYSKVVNKLIDNYKTQCYITTNYRVLVENDWLDDLQYICEPTKYHTKRITVKFTCDRGVSHEFVRHRVFSFAQESTRYCNYSKNKFGNEITYIEPCWDMQSDERKLFLLQLEQAQNTYNALISSGWSPQQARAILPNSLKTELIMTGFVDDWVHLFRLRTSFIAETGKPHPDMSNLCDSLYKEFVNRGIMESLV